MIKIDRKNKDAKAPKDKDKGLFITVFADASYCPNTNAAGYAFWVRDGQCPPYLQSDEFTAEHSTHAEVVALRHAMNYIMGLCELIDRVVVIQSDCIEALKTIDQDELISAGARFVKLKHVRGHSGSGTARSAVNSTCDRHAKKKMRAMRDRLIKERGDNYVTQPS